jgi:hypothetical protein
MPFFFAPMSVAPSPLKSPQLWFMHRARAGSPNRRGMKARKQQG